jgi:hypothetical protein
MALTWKRSAKVEGYEAGRWVIEHAEAYTLCENPHPQGKGNPYCGGGEEHPYRYWIVWKGDEGESGSRFDAYTTLREAKDAVEQVEAKEAQG